MSKKGLNIAPPPRREKAATVANDKAPAKPKTRRAPVKFEHIAESDTVQFNKRVQQSTADGYEMLAIKTRRKVPDLITEGLEMLEEKYGKV